MTGSAGAPRVRAARPEDMAQVAELAAEHAAFEKAAPPPADLAARLERLLFADGARLRCFVAEPGGGAEHGAGGRLLGYATCSPETSTWQGTEYLHMDCLFLRDGSRGHGLGPRLVAAVVEEARRLGLDAVQWNTPDWNVDAARFYDRLGARSSNKRRFTLEVARATTRANPWAEPTARRRLERDRLRECIEDVETVHGPADPAAVADKRAVLRGDAAGSPDTV